MESLNPTDRLWGYSRPLISPTTVSAVDTMTGSPEEIDTPDGPVCCWNVCTRDLGKKFPRHQSNSNS